MRRWLYSTNAKDIAILYFIFAIFSGMLGTSASVIIRLEMAAPGPQYLGGNHQVFNGAPFARTISFLLGILYFIISTIFLTLMLYLALFCVKHVTKPAGANSAVKIACYERLLKECNRVI